MKSVKKIFSFYVNSSIHVGVSTLCLVILTYAISNTLPILSVCGLVFFGTVFSYNYIKYYSFFNEKSLESKRKHNVILYNKVDTEILGGMIIEYPDSLTDASIASGLKNIKKDLLDIVIKQ